MKSVKGTNQADPAVPMGRLVRNLLKGRRELVMVLVVCQIGHCSCISPDGDIL